MTVAIIGSNYGLDLQLVLFANSHCMNLHRSPKLASIKSEENVSAEMRDGTVLKADVYRPDDDGRHPVLLLRTPYWKLNPRYIKTA